MDVVGGIADAFISVRGVNDERRRQGGRGNTPDRVPDATSSTGQLSGFNPLVLPYHTSFTRELNGALDADADAGALILDSFAHGQRSSE